MTPERARKLAQACADSWYGGAAGLNLKEAITQGILEACQETEGDLVATRAERDTYRKNIAAARVLADERDRWYRLASKLEVEARQLDYERDKLQADLAAERADAERYRWLRKHKISYNGEAWTWATGDGRPILTLPDLDVAIDAALAGEKK